MSIGILGLGYVGNSVVKLLASRQDVVTWDIKGGQDYPAQELAACDYAIVCVDTPLGADGAADVSAVAEAVRRVPTNRVLLKSTVPPGTTERLAVETGKIVCYWPEYVGESRYYNPFFPSSIEEVPFVIIGGEPEHRRWFIERLLPILGPTKTYFQCSAREAEVVKYAENAYFATKITFVNELRCIAESFGADWLTVREGWLLDPRIEPMHTAAFADEPGYAGKCLPKDLQAIVTAARNNGYHAALLEQVIRSNAAFRSNVSASSAAERESAI